MADDIGPGDVVERVDLSDSVLCGTRAIVLAVISPSELDPCEACDKDGPGLVLSVPNAAGYEAWCIYHWRKIGGSQADTVRLFTEDLNIKAPAAPELEPASVVKCTASGWRGPR